MYNYSATFLGLLLYAVYVLLPIIPATLIFRMFPDSKLAVSGPFQGLSVKASGAFGAYIVTVAMGYFLIQFIQESITASQGVAVWTVVAGVVHDDQGKTAPIGSKKITAVVFEPVKAPYFYGEELRLHISRSPMEAWPIVHISADGFESYPLDLEKWQRDGELKQVGMHQLKLARPVMLRAVPKGFQETPYPDSALAPMTPEAVLPR